MKKSKRLNHYIRLACLTGALFCYSASAFAVVMPNTQLPQGGEWVFGGSGEVGSVVGNNMTITQDQANAIIKWSGDVGFNIGSIASVEFKYNDKDKFNILNYDASGVMSQIRGTLKAENGNVYIVNPAGVFIGNSAQVDVGSLYVSNKKIELLDQWETGNTWTGDANAPEYISNFVKEKSGPATSAELMSLGHINASKVTFDGSRIVLDTELLTTGGLEHPMAPENILIKTDDSNKVVIGYDAYDEKNKTYAGKNDGTKLANLEDASDNTNTSITKADGYMWVRDLEQLQAMNTNKSGNYALRNGIGAISTKDTTFVPIGDETNPFTGKFDGLAGNVDGIDFAIFDLHVTGNNKSNLGLFGKTEGAEIRNVLLTGGEVTGTGTSSNIGALVGSATNTTIENVRNSIDVSGTGETSENIGGIVGKVEDKDEVINGKSATKISEILNAGDIQGHADVGGVVGSIAGNTGTHAVISGAENIGRVQGLNNGATYSHDIGGIAGSASNTDISNVENNLKIVGGYNVGGIVGSGENVTIKGAVNNADVTATGYTKGYYYYTSDIEHNDSLGIKDHTGTKEVQVANAGGIIGSAKNSTIGTNTETETASTQEADTAVINYGNVKSSKTGEAASDPYMAGNVGGIAGRAEDTNIYNVENKENEVFGAHNVGGIVGYFLHNSADTDTKFVVSGAVNNGGEIMATGARDAADFVKEKIRQSYDEITNIGNIGGIVGYMYGDNTYITGSANRGNVHSFEDFTGTVPASAQAANVGGIVGKINRSVYADKDTVDKQLDGILDQIKKGDKTAAVSDSYNTGEIHGFTGVGGIAGMMYNGAIVKSYNLGNLRSSYIPVGNTNYAALNMGGIVGDTTEEGNARAILYDVYNKGTIGDIKYDYYGRHVGGVVGRLSGRIDKAYNNGAIYNASAATGGIAGWWFAGDVSNVFNTGNITVNHKTSESSRVGGIAGAVSRDIEGNKLSNAYNLGVLRSFGNGGLVGGIIGCVAGTGTHVVSIDNVYSMTNMYVEGNGKAYAIIEENGRATVNKAYYVTRSGDNDSLFSTILPTNGAKQITYDNRYDYSKYSGFDFGVNDIDDPDTAKANASAWNKGYWRMYTFTDDKGNITGTMPILNAFVSSAAGNETQWRKDTNINDIQYGNAYDPLRTIITSKDKNTPVTINWQDMGLGRNESLAVLNSGLTLNNFANANAKTYYGGLIFADGALTIDGKANTDIRFSQAANIYGSSVNITAKNGDILDYGNIIAHGKQGDNSITISGKNVEILGETKSLKSGETLPVYVSKAATSLKFKDDEGNVIYDVEDKTQAMPDYATAYTYDVQANGITGGITIKADENLEVLLGQRKQGLLSSNGDISLTGGKSVYVDSDIQFVKEGKNGLTEGNLTIKAPESVLDITNIGAVTAPKYQENARVTFVQHFNDTNANDISFSNTANAMITMDLWDTDSFKLSAHTTLGDALRNMKVDSTTKGFDLFHIWIDDAAALQGINNATDKNILTYNFALKNNIDAAEVGSFETIGTGTGAGTGVYAGKFNGRGNAIVGLSVDNEASAGLFSVIDTDGEVSNLNIYSSHFTGGTVGAVAGINKGTIDNVTTFGNRINSDAFVNADQIVGSAPGGTGYISSAGGIAGINNGMISNAATNDAVATSKKDEGTQHSFAGGIAGVNTADGAKIDNSVANSDITSTEGAHALGGIVGINSDNAVVDTVRSLGIVNGTYKDTIITNNVGGIAGINEKGAQITKAYNVAHVSGGDNVGGIVGSLVGSNASSTADKYDLQEVVSAGDIYSTKKNADGKDTAQNVGGIVGSIENKNEENNKTYTYINSGRNTGEINGNKNVGGLVGYNGVGSNLQNVINDANATITGEKNVGGIAGTNAGVIDATATDLVNDGFIYGQENVGGVAGYNTGTIRKTNSNITLYVKNESEDAKFFGGAVGYNLGIINDAFNSGTIKAEDAIYVGGIVGYNAVITDEGGNALIGTINGAENKNTGIVIGKDYVGGIAGYNEGNIKGDAKNPTIVQNFGFVQAKGDGLDNGGAAGGVVGVNNVNEDNIEFASLINSGIVAGNGNTGTGGVIGVNNGNITKASLIGTVDAIVVGEGNVGGLIGINYGKVVGGRDAGGNYYAQQIYNNGKVIGGTTEFVDTLPDNSGANEWKEIGEPGNIKGYYQINEDAGSSNIGGLVGNNAGQLTAGYNTGEIKGGTNVGGVVGNNANGATVDQVFNASKNVESIADVKVVGRVVGYNKGTVTNAYDMALGITDKGADKIIGDGYGVRAEDGKKWYTYGDGETYGTDKLLSVFLTKISFEKINKIYANGKEQKIVAKAVSPDSKNYYVNVYLDNGTFIGCLKNASNYNYFDDEAAHSLADFVNSKEYDFTSSLLSGASFTDAGTYKPMFYTRQISVKESNHNNLGFYVLNNKFTVNPLNPTDPTNPDNPNNWQAEDKYPWYQWDKQRNERERKAEVHFVDGGMHVEA